MRKQNLVIFYDYFFPAFRAGGPVQSIYNLCETMCGVANVFVVCGAYEIDGTLLADIETNKWNHVVGVNVCYLTKDQKNARFIKKLLEDIKPDVFFINGMFSPHLTLTPLILWHRKFRSSVKAILSPRGMLQDSALAQKPLKKVLFLKAFQLLKLQKGIQWHATNAQEESEIRKRFETNTNVSIIPNIPKHPAPGVTPIAKNTNSLRLVFISLITEMKNLTIALKCLRTLSFPVSFDIYGPIKEEAYWDECKKEIEMMPGNVTVTYHGDLLPIKVQDTFKLYHAFMLPTKGENFGHAIYECLSVGRPVIISNSTPWKGLEDKKAGFDLALDHEEKFADAIRQLYEMDEVTYHEWCVGSWNMAKEFYAKYDFRKEYKDFFSK